MERGYGMKVYLEVYMGWIFYEKTMHLDSLHNILLTVETNSLEL